MGKAIVCAVGANSRRGSAEGERLGISDDTTALQKSLENLGSHFSKWGLICSLVIFVVMLINFFVTLGVDPNPEFGNALYKVINYLTLAIVLIVVAVPEGLPLSIGICLSYLTKAMKEHKILVKRLHSTEAMGTVQEIVTGKTGTVTSEDMAVAEWYAFGEVVKNRLKNTMTTSKFPEAWIEAVKDAVLFNTDARIELGEEATYVPSGSGTETAMLRFL